MTALRTRRVEAETEGRKKSAGNTSARKQATKCAESGISRERTVSDTEGLRTDAYRRVNWRRRVRKGKGRERARVRHEISH